MNGVTDVHASHLHDELKSKLVKVESVKESQDIYFQQVLQHLQVDTAGKVQQNLSQLNESIDQLTALYKRKPSTSSGKDIPFFYQQPTENFFSKEEAFTTALTDYTRKQFFEGIADFAGARDQSRYDLLDVSKPENLLIKGENEGIRKQDGEELKRLQSQYIKCAERGLKSQMSYESMKQAVAIAEKQLYELQSASQLSITDAQMKSEISRLSEEILKSKKLLLNEYEHKLLPILSELQQLQSTKVLNGNYDLKIARQDYFLSKQNEVINQLLLQFSRNYFLTMMYEIELKDHRNSYHLIASSKSLIEKEIKSIQKRISLLENPMLNFSNSNKETISSKDSFVNMLHDSIVSDTGDREELYKTYDTMLHEATKLSSIYTEAKHKCEGIASEKSKLIDSLDATLKEVSTVLADKKSFSNDQLSGMIHNLEDSLTMAEVQVNDTIKDIVTKRKILSGDSLKVLERTLFPAFFNDPTRLKRILLELQSRVNAYAAKS